MDFDAAYLGFYFLEFADYYAKEGNDEREMLKLLFQTMRVLTKKILPLPLVKNIFELKAISINANGDILGGNINSEDILDVLRSYTP